MKTLVSIFIIAGAITFGGTAAEQWIGSNEAQAQGSSACFQNCAYVRRWPASQCREYCAKKKRAR